jgi:hypothetical protein
MEGRRRRGRADQQHSLRPLIQRPTPDGPILVPARAIAEGKGVDIYAGRYAELFRTST